MPREPHRDEQLANAAGGDLPLHAVSDDVLQRILARMQFNDASDAPDLAGAIAAILASRLEGTPIPEEVQTAIDATDDMAEETTL